VTPLRIGLPKGRLFDHAADLFERAGIPLEGVSPKARKLLQPTTLDGIGEVEVLIIRASDVGAYVEHGVCALGVLGSDVLKEQRPNVLAPLDLGFGKCRMCLAAKPDVDALALETPRVATKYPRVAADFFLQRGAPAEIIKLSGAIEVAPLVGLADAIVDLVETGETLRQNGLVVHADVFEVSARLIVNRAAMHLSMQRVRTLQNRLRTAPEAS
jgi:ATP phosphoribosyltransferase